ncbi:hypothetical protein RHOER0001_1776 [Rhodococcus erythropolis SK121]|nr:hypothetical protein RHOER0001_1776 [Rhodococcus erythropolis SK121]
MAIRAPDFPSDKDLDALCSRLATVVEERGLTVSTADR